MVLEDEAGMWVALVSPMVEDHIQGWEVLVDVVDTWAELED